jgi:serine carboxypeptidase-like clade 1
MSFSPLLLSSKQFSLPRRQNSYAYEELPDHQEPLSSVIETYDQDDEDTATIGSSRRGQEHDISWSSKACDAWQRRPKGAVPVTMALVTGWLVVSGFLFGDDKARGTSKNEHGDTIQNPPKLQCNPPTESASHDLVTHLPGWDNGEDLPSCQYSGYIAIEDDTVTPSIPMHIHYYFMESEGNPTEDPWMVWSNGGPGASSMYGILTEVGPFIVNEHSQQTRAYKETGIPTLFRNPFAWTQLGGVVMFDWPPPVGFSYCHGNVTGDGTSCGDWDDERMARVSYLALEGFLEQKFPSLQQNKLYLTGESYAGIYIPKLAQQIVHHQKVDEWNLQGFAVGDACAGTDVMCGPILDEVFGEYYAYLFLYGHGQMSNQLWEDLLDQCGKPHLQYSQQYAPHDSDACAAAKAKVSQQVGGYFEYNLYDECTYENGRRLKEEEASWSKAGESSAGIHNPQGVQQARKVLQRQSVAPTAFERQHFADILARHEHSQHLKLEGAVNDYTCGEGVAQDVWTAQPAVRRALNVLEDSNFFSGDNGAGMNYTLTEPNLLPFYKQAIVNEGLKVMVYNGDTDPGLNSFAAQNWTRAIGLEETEEWRPWTTDSCRQMGGYVTSYEHDFTFVTIRGSGHMVPHYKPMAGFAMISNYLGADGSNHKKSAAADGVSTASSLPRYDGKCTAPDYAAVIARILEL